MDVALAALKTVKTVKAAAIYILSVIGAIITSSTVLTLMLCVTAALSANLILSQVQVSEHCSF